MNTDSVQASTLLDHAQRPAERPVREGQGRQSAREAEAPREAQPALSTQAMRKELDATLERIAAKDTRLSFKVDDDSGRTVITVRDASTSEVLKQIPSEEMLEIARRLEAHLDQSGDGSGLLLADEA